MFICYLFNFSDLLEPYISLLVWRHSLGLSGWMMLSGAWALWRLCVSDFYQGKPIRPDRGMMILGHHHSGDTAPTNPTTPSSIRQPKTPSHAPYFPCSPLLSYPLILLLHSFPSFFFALPPICFPPRLFLALTVFPLAFCLILSFPIFIALYLSVYHFPSLHSPLCSCSFSDGKHKDKFCPFLSP